MAMRFCPDCANLLAPREKPANRIEEKEKKLQYYCKICNYVDDNIAESCVYVNELVKNLCNSDRRFANYDFMLAVLFAIVGIPESINSEIIECFRDPNWESSWHPLVHQYRAKYPLSTEGYTGTHIINKNGIGDQWGWKR
jgi:DNA-directed RNA polymerase subunit M/transcription elongation factor TFIIS